MRIPFTVEEFLGLFETYNLSIWPAQLVFNILAVSSFVLLVRESRHSSRIIFSFLAFLWFWMGLVYHILFFSSINPVANVFGIAFIIQGFLFAYFGVIKGVLLLKFRMDLSGFVGLFLLVYALVIYPILGFQFGHSYPKGPTFGVPCPTTIFSFGILLFSVDRVSWYLWIIPFLWSLIGFSAAFDLSIKEDFGLVVAGVLTVAINAFQKQRRQLKS